MLLLVRLNRFLPATHLAAICICIFIIGLTASLLPTSGAATERTSVIEPVADNAPHIAASAQSTSEPSPTANSAPHPENETLNAEETVPESAAEHWQTYTISTGDNLTSLFKKAGLTARDVYSISQAVRDTQALKQLYPGQTLSFLIADQQLIKLQHIRNQLDSVLITRTADSYLVEEIRRTPETVPRFAKGTIENSLFYDASQAGLSDRMIMELAALFGWDVDFALDLREGDTFSLIYEEQFLDDQRIGEGNILAAQFINQGITYTAIRYTDSAGNSSYFTPDGDSMRKAFLRSPIDFARISSSFKSRRKHPVLGLTRAHRGTDYAARTGTPIKASGDGKIIWRGTKGGFGKSIIIQHGGNITSLYAHMNNYRKGQRVGSRVQQGDVIGYVGKTGLASGPHLHYEFRVNGVHKNPQTVKLPHAAPLAMKERSAFDAVAAELLAQLENYQATQLASSAN